MLFAWQLGLLNLENTKILGILATNDPNRIIFKVTPDFKTEDLYSLKLPKSWYLSVSNDDLYLKSFKSSTKIFIDIQS